MKTSLEAVRRRDLIEAAYQTFLEFGLKGMTAARIGKRAGLSHGMINYYFRGCLAGIVRADENSEVAKQNLAVLNAAKSVYVQSNDLHCSRSPREQ